MVRRTIDDRFEQFRHFVDPIMDRYCPYVYEQEEHNVSDLVEGEEKDVNVIGHALQEAVDRMESVRGKRCCDLPTVVRFVDGFVEEAMMQSAVDPVDEEVGEEEEREDVESKTRPS